MYRVHKRNRRGTTPLVSIILLDWSCRERFHALDWLSSQSIPRERYELIWVELYDRLVPTVIDGADIVITCNQTGTYHKHEGYNAGLLEASGEIVTVCDSDAVFPSNFIESIVHSFALQSARSQWLVLMHYEWRTKSEYPDELKTEDEMSRFKWDDLWPNVGACMSVRRLDAIRFGGFDEHASYRGYICGPYELGWRLVNAGIPEVWHDEKVALRHFAHPMPHASAKDSWFGSLRRWFEVRSAHVDYHALNAVEAFSTGRLLPLRENEAIHRLRMSLRRIGTEYEANYARKTGPEGFSKWEKLALHLPLLRETIIRFANLRKLRSFLRAKHLVVKGKQ